MEVFGGFAATGPRTGDEVPQRCFRQGVTSVTTDELSLVSFERSSLVPGEGKTVAFKLPARELARINRQENLVVEARESRLHFGSSSRDLRLHGLFAKTGS